MKQLSQLLKNYINIRFISISADTNKERWKNSVAKGLYSDPAGINLYTAGKGIGHELISYYGFLGMPKILVIDKKLKIFNSNPMRPHNAQTEQEFITMLRALAE